MISKEEVKHLAKLAEVGVSDTELPKLTEQLGRIVDYVAQLAALPGGDMAEPFHPGPDSVTLRADVVAPVALQLPMAALAPELKDGLLVVPRLPRGESAE